MNEKITLPTLVSLLSEKTGKNKRQCENFVKEFFNTISESLVEGDSVRIKGLGTFKVLNVMERKSVSVNTGEDIEIPSHSKISFIACKELAEAVNSPFSMFETVELPDDISEEEENREKEELLISRGLAAIDVIDPSENKDSMEENTDADDNRIQQIYSEEEKEETDEKSDINNSSDDDESLQSNSSEEVDIETDTNNPSNVENCNIQEIETAYDDAVINKKKNYRFLLGFGAGVAFTALLSLGAYLFLFSKWTENFSSPVKDSVILKSETKALPSDTISNNKNENENKNETVVSNSKQQNSEYDDDIAPTRPSDEPVYDTITKTRYLTTMAKEHYGNYNLWPYIYEENKSMLGHPDRIRPGTRIVIPPLSKYGVNPNNEEDIKKAKQMGVQIYSRYQ